MTAPFLAGAPNFRDLGGYPTADGRHRTRAGRLFRSDALHELTAADLDALRALGLATVIDLSTPTEAARLGHAPLDVDVRSLNLSVSQDGMARERPASLDLAERYVSYLDGGGPALVRALEEIATPEQLPLVFHCFFGKDRTGVLAALVLGCLGVDRRAIIDDYALSSEGMRRLVERWGRDPVYRDTLERTPSALLAADPETMDRFLLELEERHGGARAWARAAGVSTRHLDQLDQVLLEDVG
jgi:protein-tyrosine phosphatase